MSQGTADALGVADHPDTRILQHKVPTVICGWRVLPFHVIHDAAEPMGFMLDTGYGAAAVPDRHGLLAVPVRGPDPHAGRVQLFGRALEDAIDEGRTHGAQRHRLRENHMSENTLVQLLQANDLRNLREIHLIHLSDSNPTRRR